MVAEQISRSTAAGTTAWAAAEARPSPAPPMTESAITVTPIHEVESNSFVSAADRRAFKAKPGAGTAAASGSTVDAAPTSSLAAAATAVEEESVRPSPARPTTGAETTAAPTLEAVFRWSTNEAAHPASRARLGAGMAEASGLTADAARNSSSVAEEAAVATGEEAAVAIGVEEAAAAARPSPALPTTEAEIGARFQAEEATS